ncbi:hypothetical protein PHET_04989 [Paragonimus heterotremus]|uniref:LisH domain-containing protein n=1 Tax=Paragonimus heterotremus TaxID=100268 RepID=A0A8J4WRN8_9TREM|nr:hypothetical protein PHET_04989 [Paragonimus heterotremus]
MDRRLLKTVKRKQRSSVPDSNMKMFLYQLLKNTGDLDNLKSRIRQRMILELNAHASLRNEQSQHEAPVTDEIMFYRDLTNSLFSEHLQNHEYIYTLSVFLPECGLSEKKVLRPFEVMRLLGVENEAESFEQLDCLRNDTSTSVICKLLKFVSLQMKRTVEHKIVQTNDGLEMEDRLQGIDREYELRRILEVDTTKRAFENRLNKYRQVIAEDAQLELRSQMDAFRRTQMVQLRLEMEEEFQQKLSEHRQQLEERFQMRLEALTERENQLKQKEITIGQAEEHEAFRFRQKLQTESEFLHAQSVLLKQEREQLKRERDRLVEEHRVCEKAMEMREKQLALKEDALEHRIHQEVKR